METSNTLTVLSLSMTSREIAELTDKQHSNVLRDIRAMLVQVHDLTDDSVLNHQVIQGVVIERDFRNYIALIRLDKDHTLTLLTGYDAKARFKVIRRWQELEAAFASTLQQPSIQPDTYTLPYQPAMKVQIVEL
ncbi:Rha family transcriptional regulator, partial [Chromatium okenii]|uniref:Rha family transcriptional regulator n=1 Tax=Chromatium okenii TaxID=61644 RepID=UPI0026EAFBC6